MLASCQNQIKPIKFCTTNSLYAISSPLPTENTQLILLSSSPHLLYHQKATFLQELTIAKIEKSVVEIKRDM